MTLSKVMIIRHGEKPEPGQPELGIDENGGEDRNELIVRGWQRAGALARFFWPPHGKLLDAPLAAPEHLFAPSPNAAEPSKRALHTLAPLSKLGGLDIHDDFGVGDEQRLATAIAGKDGVVLVAWEHKHIKDIVGALSNGAAKSPHWPSDRFDMVLVLTPPFRSAPSQVPQLVLAGDSAQPFADERDS